MISAIITAYKEKRTIKKAVESIEKQKVVGEIIIIAPDKETLDEAFKLKKVIGKIKVIKDKGEGKPAALNLAVFKAKGDILVLTDGDVFVEEGAITSLLKPFDNPKIGAVTGRPIPLNNKKTMLGFWAYILLDLANKERINRIKNSKPILLSGYLLAIRKEIMRKIPLDVLDDAYISQFVIKKGYETGYANNAFVYVKNPATIKDWLKQKIRNAGGAKKIKYYLGNKTEMRNLKNELLCFYKPLFYPRSITEVFYTIVLYPMRLYVWVTSKYKINIQKKEMKDLWVRINSTK